VLRFVGTALADALAVTGRLDEAERQFQRTLNLCRSAQDRPLASYALEGLARVELRTGRRSPAREHLWDAIKSSAEIGDRLRVADCLSDLAVWVMPERPQVAAELWGAGRAMLASIGIPRPALDEITDRADPGSAYDSDFLTGRILPVLDALGPKRAAAAERRGAALSPDDAVSLAFAALDDAGATTSPVGVGPALSKRERELIDLVAEGLTDQDIANKLFISVRTVRTHLDRIKAKTGIRRRAELTRLAIRLQLGAPAARNLSAKP
jgi:DNA-binding CsgD family transcriptional regulator